MSLHEAYNRNLTQESKADLEYHLIYAACFALYLVPVAARHVSTRLSGQAGDGNSILAATNVVAANRAASAFVGL